MVAVDGVRAVLVTPRAEIRPQPQALALIPVGAIKDLVPGRVVSPANQAGGLLVEDAGCIAVAVQFDSIFIQCYAAPPCAYGNTSSAPTCWR